MKLTSGGKLLQNSDGVILDNGAISLQVFPTRARMWHGEANILSGGALTREPWSFDDHQVYIYCALQDPDADGDSFSQSFLLAEGTYTLHIIGAGDANNGYADWYIDDVLIVSGQDWYTSGPDYNIHMTVGPFAVDGNGRHVLKGVINGKQSISTGYYLPLSKYWIEPASDEMEVE